MDYDEHLATWLNKPLAKIKRSGELDLSQVAEVSVAYYKNGISLLADARYLISDSRYSRAAALIVLALEELAKVKIVVETFLKAEHKQDPEAWSKHWKTGGHHRKK